MKLIRRSHEARQEEVRRRLEGTYERVVRKVKLRLLRPDGEARDLVHNVAVTLLRNGTHRIDSWVAYQTTAAVNESNKEQENKKLIYFSDLSEEEERRIVEEVPGSTKSPADLAAEHELIDMALEEVANLPFKQRAVLMMYCSEYKHEEIAAALGLKSAETSRSHLRHALNTLRERLRARGFFDCTF
jgi:RNA polymerase sigma factor (sigma-70 family)